MPFFHEEILQHGCMERDSNKTLLAYNESECNRNFEECGTGGQQLLRARAKPEKKISILRKFEAIPGPLEPTHLCRKIIDLYLHLVKI